MGAWLKIKKASWATLVSTVSLGAALALPAKAPALDLGGFVEAAAGVRTESDTTVRDDYNMLEARVQLKGFHYLDAPGFVGGWSPELSFKAEAVAEGYERELRFSLREAAISATPADFIDVRLGRQVLTWGTGDLLFVNDLFPKDYVSFFIGRDTEYLKLPSDAVRVSVFADIASFDVAVMPQMEANNSVTGERVSFYDGLTGTTAGAEAGRSFIEPVKTPENMEVGARAYRTFGSFEAAAYFFRGFYKEPRGILNAGTKEFYYPRLNVYGASVRGPGAGGIVNLELGFYDSREDTDGTNASVENSAMKYMAGYTRDMGSDLSLGLQYLVEQMLDYDAYYSALGAAELARDEFRQLITLRLTKLMYGQTLTAGFFIFYSPTDADGYLRPIVSYKVTDELSVTAGANIFAGRDIHTEFGALDRNDNVYLRARWGF